VPQGAVCSIPVIVQAFPDVDLADAAIGAEVAETSGVKRERCSGSTLDPKHLADDDEVISARVYRVHLAVEAAECVLQVWRLRPVVPVAVDFELVVRAASKAEREIELVVREDMHREGRRVGEGRRCAAAARQAPQEQRWLE